MKAALESILNEHVFRTDSQKQELARQAISLMHFHRGPMPGTYATQFTFSNHFYRVVLIQSTGSWFLLVNGKDVRFAYDTKTEAVQAVVRMMATDSISEFANE